MTFTHDVAEPVSGYGYSYTKAIRLTAGQPELKLEHHLKNTGRQRIDTTVYNHNFLVLDGLTTGAGFVVRTPYEIVSARPPTAALAEIRGRSVVYLADLAERQTVTTPLTGFGPTAADYDFRVEHTDWRWCPDHRRPPSPMRHCGRCETRSLSSRSSPSDWSRVRNSADDHVPTIPRLADGVRSALRSRT